MEHTEATRLLSDAGRGRLSTDTEQALNSHLAECSDCGGWLATYQLLSGALSECSPSKHLNSKDLCTFALDAPALDPDAREHCDRHIADCAECSEEIELVRAAAREPSTATPSIGNTRPWQVLMRPGRLALAASVILAIGWMVVVDRLPTPVPDEFRLDGHSVHGTRIIEAREFIVVEATEIEAGSVLNLQSASIAFGDGFSVELGASLVAGSAGGS